MLEKLIGYYRVSTKKQGASGLGLEGQQAAVEAYAKQTGAKIVRAYTEVESGKNSERPELGKALADARRSKATLCVAKLDRLSRNVAFTSAVMDSGTDFVACDNPVANRLTLHILAAMAEHEAKEISKRTKAALAAYKARGGKLGGQRPECRTLTPEARKRGALESGKVVHENALKAYADLLPMMTELRSSGATLQAIAAELNAQGHTTRRGKPWNYVQVGRVLERGSGEGGRQ